jgi:hypothetical protein
MQGAFQRLFKALGANRRGERKRPAALSGRLASLITFDRVCFYPVRRQVGQLSVCSGNSQKLVRGLTSRG